MFQRFNCNGQDVFFCKVCICVAAGFALVKDVVMAMQGTDATLVMPRIMHMAHLNNALEVNAPHHLSAPSELHWHVHLYILRVKAPGDQVTIFGHNQGEPLKMRLQKK